MRKEMSKEEAMLRLVSLNEHEGETLRICAEDAKALQMGIDAIKALDQDICEDCISRQAVNILVDELARAISDERCCMSRGRSTASIMQDILDLPSVQPQTEWIPVNEKLPKNGYQEVLISLEWGIDIGRYSDGEWHSEWINHYDDGNVLAWQPLPKPYHREVDE